MLLWTVHRGLPIINILWPKLRYAVRAVPYIHLLFDIVLLALIPFADEGISKSFIAYYDILSGIYVIAFEAFVLWVYLRYLQKSRRNLTSSVLEVSPFEIIASYGVASCFVILVLEALTALSGNYEGDNLTVNIAILLGQHICPLLYMYIQLGMKWALYKDRRRIEAARSNALEIAKRVASGMRTPEASVLRSVMENNGFE
ncbi:hypothetical protein HDU99_008566, partial [Rhizoclosmatium hyalinum]